MMHHHCVRVHVYVYTCSMPRWCLLVLRPGVFDHLTNLNSPISMQAELRTAYAAGLGSCRVRPSAPYWNALKRRCAKAMAPFRMGSLRLGKWATTPHLVT
uniref:Uncharacterized protein n=1 Tax=Anguilla anguilla TaxID=7936 RepID=A0A0E9WY89_ANGAN